MLTWNKLRNLENSLKDFLDGKVSNEDIDCSIRVGRKEDNKWSIPCITLYVESQTSTRLEIGSNKRDNLHLMILDIYATNEGERLDLADWLSAAINDGFRYYSYTQNESNPESPTKVAGGLVGVEFVTNARVSLGQNIDETDKYRHRITINVWIATG